MALKMKITYATMSADNEELQAEFDVALDKVKSSMLGLEVPLFIDGKKVYAPDKTAAYSPIDTCDPPLHGAKRDAGACATGRDRGAGCLPGLGQDAVARTGRRDPPDRRPHPGDQFRALLDHGHGGGEEPPGGPG